MPVYVDQWHCIYRGMKMCHMAADTTDELHAMADKIGVQRRWFQNKSLPHYDICLTKRKLAIKHGAIEMTSKQLVRAIRNSQRGNTNV